MRAFLAVIVLGTWGLAQVLAVAPFADRGSGLLGVELGLAEVLEGKLRELGFPTIPARALDSWRTGQGLAPSPEAWKKGAQALGADYLVLGTLEKLENFQFTLTLGFFQLQAVNATAEISLLLWDVQKAEEVETFLGKSSGQGQVNASFRVFLSVAWDVCSGNFRTNKSVYGRGEPVLLGYLDPNPPGTFLVVIRALANPSLIWTSAEKTSAVDEPCLRWTWDQMFGGTEAGPGAYVAELYQVTGMGPVLAAETHFSVEPACALWAAELRFGTPEFAATPWYQALSSALTEALKGLAQSFAASP